jgi:hypothetical protein
MEDKLATASLAQLATVFFGQLGYLRGIPMGILYTSADPKPYSNELIVSTS